MREGQTPVFYHIINERLCNKQQYSRNNAGYEFTTHSMSILKCLPILLYVYFELSNSPSSMPHRLAGYVTTQPGRPSILFVNTIAAALNTELYPSVTTRSPAVEGY
ncbi:hypothetical protein H112_08078 [Trichophyton rubrum D6]|uniref:Uncharacterized protein n=3 Tax=Trichophyton TaxID=5550 RepID=A0A080WI99_TRIRC|nr:uncharacterized protein TERG_11609 [Trichophyton rubrum CBS 118892]EZF10717.1 hypothetical protein H100_08106 [Trichophyton rubrum MR850]EZF37589.1 hypothetical protein H102_08062 [Trichophyton rubrum CBS 100081]EZF48157.1 hypothetical protein H103_08088 [Trichophyton rubrum CBS 288.86]EZF58879.1 hypothetical protein H104_08036 [Trichophyton rubrum CBS 289.86]EZF69412.1 hypothetical protein H105_08088 [Trichophyton soudanense CBS 452.61]EZF80159.1 hypothetical protein H110_08089 [Trichophy